MPRRRNHSVIDVEAAMRQVFTRAAQDLDSFVRDYVAERVSQFNRDAGTDEWAQYPRGARRVEPPPPAPDESAPSGPGPSAAKRRQPAANHPGTTREWAARVLGVQPTAPPEVIDAAYKALSFKYHPDRGGDPAMMMKINKAREVLR